MGKNNKRIITKSRHKPSLVAALTTSRTAESSPGPGSPQRPQPQEEEEEEEEVGEILEPQPSQLEPVLVKTTGEKVEVRPRPVVTSAHFCDHVTTAAGGAGRRGTQVRAQVLHQAEVQL